MLEGVHLAEQEAGERVAVRALVAGGRPCWSVPVVVKAKEPVGFGGEMALSWYQRRSAPNLKAWRPASS